MRFLLKPEYIALVVSVLTIVVTVYIAWENRKYSLAKEEYFKLKQVAEKVISKLINLDNHRTKLKSFFELSYLANTNKNSIFVDGNDTFNKSSFEKDGDEIAAFIHIYFTELGDEWNECLDKMGTLFTTVFIINKKLEIHETPDWKGSAETFNKTNRELGELPQNLISKIKKALEKYKEAHL